MRKEEEVADFNSAYSSCTAYSDKPPQIHALALELREEIGSLAAKKQQGGPMFPVRGAKELNQKLAEGLRKLKLLAPVIKQEVTFCDTTNIPANINDRGRPTFRTLVHVVATVRLIAPDGSYLDFVGSGHGGDVDDKAGGKASTYAWKDAILKGLSIPHEDMVDTDDDAGEEPKRGFTPPSGPANPNAAKFSRNEAAQPASEPVAGGSGYEYVAKKIKDAKTEAELEEIKLAIANGTLSISGADRLRASKDWVERKKEIKS